MLAALALGGALARGADGLSLRWGEVDTDGEAAVGERAELTAGLARRKGDGGERGAYVVQFGETVRAEWREWLEGVTQVRGYLPENAYLVWATAGEMAEIAEAEAVSWIGEWQG